MMRSSSCSTRRRARARARRSRRLDERGLFGGRRAWYARDAPRLCRQKAKRGAHADRRHGAMVVFLVVIFIGTGVMQPLLISTLGNLGAYDKSSFCFCCQIPAWRRRITRPTSSRLARSDGRRWPYSAQSTCSRSFSASMVSRSPAALCTLSSIRRAQCGSPSSRESSSSGSSRPRSGSAALLSSRASPSPAATSRQPLATNRARILRWVRALSFLVRSRTR